jgi:hypothetical protein
MVSKTYEAVRDSGQETEPVISPAMISAGLLVFRAWQDSDEPDDRVMVRDLLEAALRVRAASS